MINLIYFLNKKGYMNIREMSEKLLSSNLNNDPPRKRNTIKVDPSIPLRYGFSKGNLEILINSLLNQRLCLRNYFTLIA